MLNFVPVTEKSVLVLKLISCFPSSINSYLLLFSEKSVPVLPGPRLSQAVFVKVLESREGIEVRDESGGDRDETVDLVAGAQHLLQYNVVRGLLDEGSVALI